MGRTGAIKWLESEVIENTDTVTLSDFAVQRMFRCDLPTVTSLQ